MIYVIVSFWPWLALALVLGAAFGWALAPASAR